MNSIVFRCDASLSIGSGHVIRCRTLARELQRRGDKVTFICRRQPGDLIALLEQEFDVLVLPFQCLALTEGLSSRELYGAWLGCEQDIDANQCLEALYLAGVIDVAWLVVDHYGLDERWESLLIEGLARSAYTPYLLAIDDLADRPHQADLLLDQNFFGDAADKRYQNLVPTRCRTLLGPQYALLGPEYAYLHQLVPPRTDLRRILIFFGGVDSANLTSRALQALLDPPLSHLAVDVVLGMQSPHRQEVSQMLARRPLTTLHSSLPSLAGLIVRADLAIGACGSSTWERVCLDLPSLVVISAENQMMCANALDLFGYIKLIGNTHSVTGEVIRLALLERLDHLSLGNSPRVLTDGRGTYYTAQAMCGQ